MYAVIFFEKVNEKITFSFSSYIYIKNEYMRKKLTTKEFIEKATQIHGDKYDYSKVEYVNSSTKVCIICPKHGEFWQIPNSHLKGCGCFKCGVENSAKGHLYNTKKFIEKAKFIFGNSYDYSEVKYVSSSKKVKIKCNKCGNVFEMTPNNHLSGQGCPKCASKKKGGKKNINEVIEKARKIHGDKYDYSKVEYRGANEKICIICPIHGEFWQTPANHLRGQGCPKCNSSKLEENLSYVLDLNRIEYIRQYKIKELGRQSLDFYLPQYHIAIECQGRQHIYPTYFGSKDMNKAIEYFNKITILDKNKRDICKNNNIQLVYFMSSDIVKKDALDEPIYNDENIFWDSKKLIDFILKL